MINIIKILCLSLILIFSGCSILRIGEYEKNPMDYRFSENLDITGIDIMNVGLQILYKAENVENDTFTVTLNQDDLDSSDDYFIRIIGLFNSIEIDGSDYDMSFNSDGYCINKTNHKLNKVNSEISIVLKAEDEDNQEPVTMKLIVITP